MAATTITPVTVLTGFLGSGKTTLLARALKDPAFADTAVLVNEWGEIPLDHALVREASENVVVLPSGCICCQVAGDLVRELRDLHFKRANGEIPPFRRAVIETTGLADPAPLLRTLIELPLVSARYALAGVVTTVDAVHGARTLDEHAESVKQVAVADRLVLTKTDLAGGPALDALLARLAALNPGAGIERATHGDLEPARLFATGLSHPNGGAPDVTGWLGRGGGWQRVGHAGPHDARIRSFAWRHEGPIDADVLVDALESLLAAAGERILRMKGLANVLGEPGPWAVHAVQHALYPPAKLAAWPPDPEFADRATRLVFITRDLEASQVAPILDSFVSRTACNPPPTISSPSPS